MPDKPWDTIHIDHAGPVEGHWPVIVIDAKPKLLEVILVPNTASVKVYSMS